jgi:hypothetical protein
VTPLVTSYVRAADDPASQAAYWQPAVSYLRGHLTPSYRVEAVDTAGHWAALYLPRTGIPLARGWFRQDDFPQNELLYDRLGARSYVRWLRRMGVRYVLLTTARPDYSARVEAALVSRGRVPLKPVFRTPALTVYELPSPTPIITGPGAARLNRMDESSIVATVARTGDYRIAVRYSRYWQTSVGCVRRAPDGMIRLAVPRPGPVRLAFSPTAGRAIAALTGRPARSCAR